MIVFVRDQGRRSPDRMMRIRRYAAALQSART